MVEIAGRSSQSARGRMPTGLRAIQSSGNKVLLENGRTYTDWMMGSHGAIYGYAPNWWIEALTRAAKLGQGASIACRDERIVAEMLPEFYPDIESVRFMCTGSDPCAAAVKLARAVTGRDKLLVYGYHGTNQAFCTPPEVSGTSIDMRRGALEADRAVFVPLAWEPKADDSFPALDESIAAVVIELPSVDEKETVGGWLRQLFDRAHAVGTLVVLDEVKTGFRYAKGGAAEYYGLQGRVDLYCLGKTLGNGYPVSCLMGKRAILKELTNGVHFSGTFFGEPIGMALAKATLHQMMISPPWSHLYYLGKQLMAQWNSGPRNAIPMIGHPTRPELSGPRDVLTEMVSRQFGRGHIIAQSPWYVTFCTTREDIEGLLK